MLIVVLDFPSKPQQNGYPEKRAGHECLCLCLCVRACAAGGWVQVCVCVCVHV